MPEAPTYRNALPLGSMLLEYRLESVLGAGGFGMTYLGWDTNLEKHVAIKEYLPGELAIRALDGSVVPVNTENEYNYKWGLDRFIQEARTLAKFSHPNIVRVNRFFEANGTSYMVMDYEAGESLYQNLRRAPMPEETTLKNILMPILDGLQAVHQAGFLHRDIKPSNVFIRENGVPLLIDFGSARLTAGSVSKSRTAIVSPGYAPLEQYTSSGNQGPWSDIYALSGVVYRAVTGENPPDAVSRMKADNAMAVLTAARARYSERFLKAIEWGMMLDEKMRPQSVAEWRDLFLGRAPLTAFSRSPSAVSAPRVSKTMPQRHTTSAEAESRSTGGGKWLIGGGIALIVLALGATWSKRYQQAQETVATQTAPSAQATTQPETRAEPLPSPPALEVETPAAPAPRPAPAAPAVPIAPPATTAQTATEPLPEIPLDMRRKLMEAFRAADADGDGYLSPDEVRGRFPFIAQNFPAVDIDRDGRISPAELWQLRKKQQTTKQRP